MNSGICDYGCTNYYSGDMCCVQNDNCIECASYTECKKCKSGYFGNLCEESCPVYCLDSCDILTGVCRDCVINHFGSFCNLNCSENCNASRSSASRNCASSDGRCLFGCKYGFFGLKCDKKCSLFCTGSLCEQESGICVKGCTDRRDDFVCLLSLGKQQSVSDNNSATTTNIVLAILLALTTAALFVLIVKKIVSKIRSTNRQSQESVIQIPFQNLHREDVTTVSEAGNVAYEVIDTTRGAPEHTYGTASSSAHENTMNAGNTVYMNLQI